MWAIEVEDSNSIDKYLVHFETDRELGIFLQNYDKTKYRVRKIYKGEYDVTNPERFITKPKGLETGGSK